MGFTLIELLVVISIIALLVGILLPALGAARRTAMAMKCASNQKQMGTAWFAYAVDHEGAAVGSWQSYVHPVHLGGAGLPGKHWYVDLYPYYSTSIGILECPVAPEPNPQFASAPAGTLVPGGAAYAWYESGQFSVPLNYGGFGYNNWLEKVTPGVANAAINAAGGRAEDYRLDMGIDELVATSETPLFGDSAWADTGWPLETNPLPPNYISPYNSTGAGYLERMCVDRHNEAINVTFLDGSARRIRILDLWSLKWHAKWDATDPPNLP